MAWSGTVMYVLIAGSVETLCTLNLVTGSATYVNVWASVSTLDIAWYTDPAGTTTGLYGYSGTSLYKLDTSGSNAPELIGTTSPLDLVDGNPVVGMSREPTSGSLIAMGVQSGAMKVLRLSTTVPVMNEQLAYVSSAGDALAFGRVGKTYSPEPATATTSTTTTTTSSRAAHDREDPEAAYE
ncbi:hypothetical protein Pelo_3505 [Pelomyxa schiedti]|nr:hypothetical protein Pelo_3505 [Pelomyxa schiedti]